MPLSLATPIGFAWVDSDETTFGVEHHVIDEDVFDFTILHEEGQIPSLTVTIRTPRNGLGVAVGLLSVGRKQWAWLSWFNPATELVEPLFFGRLVAVPDGFSGGELLTLQFIARANDWISRKQTLADTLKVRPYYDPIFLDDKSRNDPDAILEGYSAAYHVDRTTLAWTISDILEGEDGTVAFDGDDIIYDTLKIDVSSTPIRQVRVDAKVNWTQNTIGSSYFVGAWTVETYTGSSLISAWPKPGTDLGGGWKAGPMTGAVDLGNIEFLEPYTESGSASDNSSKHAEGDTISVSYSGTTPKGPYGGIVVAIRGSEDYGVLGGSMFEPDEPNPTDGSSSVQSSWTYIPLWKVFCQLDLIADGAANPFTEALTFTVNADIQSVLQDSDTQSETEVIDISSVDVGSAIIDYVAWSSVAGSAVSVGQVMLPNIPVGPGGLSFQICVTAGTCATEAPLFSDVVGSTTTDGSAVWACVGATLPSIGEWQAGAYFFAGSIITVPALGGYFFLAANSGYSGALLPALNPFYGAVTLDGTVAWIGLMTGGPSIIVPVGGMPGNVTQTAFFGQDRGAWAIEYLIQKASAVIRRASRAIDISFQIPFALGVELSCRKSALITCKDIPGGAATGKIVSYALSGSGETGEFVCDVKVGCAVGSGGSITPAEGDPVYVDDDYVGADYQQYIGQVIDLGGVGYAPPTSTAIAASYAALAYANPVLHAAWSGSKHIQRLAIEQAFYEQDFRDLMAALSERDGYSGASLNMRSRSDALVSSVKSASDVLAQPENSIYFDITLRPISGTQYSTPYSVSVTNLYIPKQIDLEAS